MKKVIYLSTLLLISFIFTACGNDNKLVCYEELNGGEYKQSLIISYNKEKTQVQESSIEVKINVNKMEPKDLGCTKETKEECLVELENRFNDGCNNLLNNCKIDDKNDNGFTFTADIKKEKLDEYFGEISITLPINQMRSKIETKFGFTCE